MQDPSVADPDRPLRTTDLAEKSARGWDRRAAPKQALLTYFARLSGNKRSSAAFV